MQEIKCVPKQEREGKGNNSERNLRCSILRSVAGRAMERKVAYPPTLMGGKQKSISKDIDHLFHVADTNEKGTEDFP